MDTFTKYDAKQNEVFSGICKILLCIITVVAVISLGWTTFLSITYANLRNQRISNSDKIDEIIEKLGSFQLLSEKNQEDGYTPLDGGAVVPDANLPPELVSASIYRGCWNAAVNFPTLASGAGNNGEFFIVCIPGSFLIDGVSEWNLYDIIIFDGGLGSWLHVEGGRKVINDVSPIGPEEFSIIVDGEGPFFSLLKLAAGPGITLSQTADVITIELEGSAGAVTLNDSGTGSSLIVVGIGPDLDIKKLQAGNNIDITEDATSITISNNAEFELNNLNGGSNVIVSNDGLFVANPGNTSPFDIRALQGEFGISVDTFTDHIEIETELNLVTQGFEVSIVVNIDPVSGNNWVPSVTIAIAELAACPLGQRAISCGCSCTTFSPDITCWLEASFSDFSFPSPEPGRICICNAEIVAVANAPQNYRLDALAYCTT